VQKPDITQFAAILLSTISSETNMSVLTFPSPLQLRCNSIGRRKSLNSENYM